MNSVELLNLSEEDWKHKIQTEEIPMETLSCFASHIPEGAWQLLAIHQKLTAQFILDFHFYLSLPVLLTNQVIHEKTIRENLWLFQDHMWYVCRYQYLSQEFLIDHRDIVNWKQIFLHQKHLKISFIIKNFNRFPRHEFIYDPLNAFSPEVYHPNAELIKKMIFTHNSRIKKRNAVITSRS